MKRLRQYTHTLSTDADSPADPVAEVSNLPWVINYYSSLSRYSFFMLLGVFLMVGGGKEFGDFIGSLFFALTFLVALVIDKYFLIPGLRKPLETSYHNIIVDGYPLVKIHKFMSWHIQSRPLFFLPLLGIDLFVNAFSLFSPNSILVCKVWFFPVILLRQLVGYIKFGVCDVLLKSLDHRVTGRGSSSNPHDDLNSPTNPSGLLNSSSPNYIHRP